MPQETSYYSDYIKQRIRTVKNWPQPGVNFRDITSLLQSPATFRRLVDCFIHRYYDFEIDTICCIDARGFIIGGALAYELNTSLVPIRKKGKLPWETISESYALEYGTAEVEIHKDSFKPGERVLLLDDLIATGGTMLAAASLIKKLQGNLLEAAAIIDLPGLQGSKKLGDAGIDVFTICSFDED
ncbi:MAG: adenine phosphoribosyltransferase [Gammaproteobacteria bacterium]|nr:adenine phosphoribosyltransferase [Gammaproteobacteria bacterium]